jgi:hypothetical protein
MKRLAGPVVVLALGLGLVGCGAETTQVRPDPLERLLATSEPMIDRANGPDTWEVVVCRVPRGATDPLYAEFDDRMERDADEIVALLRPVSDYYERWSGGRYELRFVPAANEVSILSTESSQQCVDRALDRSSPTADGVVVVADAQHARSAEGGRGGPGSPCVDDCPAKTTGRYVYVGASDFMSVWGSEPPLDLIEHELGHGLDWPHSSLDAESLDGVVYDSPYDHMSNSAAAREADETLRHGPGILAVNLLAAGWLDRTESWWLGDDTRVVEVGARSDHASSNPRLVSLSIDESRFYSIELVSASGDDAFHESDFVLIHRVEITPGSGFDRRQFLVSDELRAGEAWTQNGVAVRVLTMGDGRARIEISEAA